MYKSKYQADATDNNMASVLVVDDDPKTIRFMFEIFAGKGIRANLANNKKAAVDFLDKNICDLVFISEKLSPVRNPGDCVLLNSERAGISNGVSLPSIMEFDLVGQIKSNMPELPIIMMVELNTGQLSVEDLHLVAQAAVKADRMGCCHFLVKPLDREKIEVLLDAFLPNHSVSTISSAQEASRCLYQIVGRSPKLIETISLAEKIAPTTAPVLISGESGTGKELISFLIHYKSRRVQGPYIKVSCVALSDSLLESELFGHEKGAFTGAYARRRGRFEMAHGGTLLLDEISETPLKFQAKLLRILEQQEFERVGGNENVRVNVRIISTTNRDLLEEVKLGRFRQDLYYRLSGVRLVIPPLRQRLEDLPELLWHFVNLHARDAQRQITELDPSMMDVLAKYHWPGNVRQLRNVVLTSLILGDGPILSLADVSWLFDDMQTLPQQRTDQGSGVRGQGSGVRGQNYDCRTPDPRSPNLGGVPLVQIERRAILDTLRQTAGNQTKAAKVLGISDRTLRDKMRRYREERILTTVS